MGFFNITKNNQKQPNFVQPVSNNSNMAQPNYGNNNGMYNPNNMNYNQAPNMNPQQMPQMQQMPPQQRPQAQGPMNYQNFQGAVNQPQNMNQQMMQQAPMGQVPSNYQENLNYQNEQYASHLVESLDENVAPRSVEQLESNPELQNQAVLPRQAEQAKAEEEARKREEEAYLDPLNNDKNPIPVNPIGPIEVKDDVDEIGIQKDVKANFFSALGIVLGMILKPGTTMVNNSKKYRNMGKAISITLWLSVIFLILCLGVRVVVGAFRRTYSSLLGDYTINFDLSNLVSISNYLPYLVFTLILTVVGVLAVSLIYYASSFLNSKGIHFSTYLIISNLAMIPFISGMVVLYPIASLASSYIGIAAVTLSFLTTLITLLIGMNSVLRFENLNKQIFYHVLNVTIILVVVSLIYITLLRFGVVSMPEFDF